MHPHQSRKCASQHVVVFHLFHTEKAPRPMIGGGADAGRARSVLVIPIQLALGAVVALCALVAHLAHEERPAVVAGK